MAISVHQHWSYINKDDLDGVIDRSMSILGYSVCKPEQKDSARIILYEEDVFVSVPTGYGNSATFQMLPTCGEMLLSTIEGHDVHPAVLISLLNSLITDQLKRFNAAGLSAIHHHTFSLAMTVNDLYLILLLKATLVIFLPVLKPYRTQSGEAF